MFVQKDTASGNDFAAQCHNGGRCCNFEFRRRSSATLRESTLASGWRQAGCRAKLTLAVDFFHGLLLCAMVENLQGSTRATGRINTIFFSFGPSQNDLQSITF